jgi:hypothetical protein
MVASIETAEAEKDFASERVNGLSIKETTPFFPFDRH